MLASLAQIVIGCTGLIGMLIRFIGPLTIVPTIVLVGLPLFEPAYNYASMLYYILIQHNYAFSILNSFLNFFMITIDFMITNSLLRKSFQTDIRFSFGRKRSTVINGPIVIMQNCDFLKYVLRVIL